MKIQIALMLLVGISVSAQTNLPSPTLTTNWVTAAPNFREFNGELYNVELSKSWHSISGTIQDISGQDILVNATILTADAREGFEDKSVIVKHFPGEKAMGNHIEIRAIHAGTAEWTLSGTRDKEIYQLWDYGLPHRVMVVVTNTTKAVHN